MVRLDEDSTNVDEESELGEVHGEGRLAPPPRGGCEVLAKAISGAPDVTSEKRETEAPA